MRVIVNGRYVGIYGAPEQRDKQFLRNQELYKPGSIWLYEVNGGTFLDGTVATAHGNPARIRSTSSATTGIGSSIAAS